MSKPVQDLGGLLVLLMDKVAAPSMAIPPIKVPKASNAPFLPKGVAGTKMDPRNKFKKSREVGYEEAFDQKTDGIKFEPPKLKMAFQTSAYSGPLTEGAFKSRSHWGMPNNPGGIKVSGPESEKKDAEKKAYTLPQLAGLAGLAGGAGAVKGSERERPIAGAVGGGLGAAAGLGAGALLTSGAGGKLSIPVSVLGALGGAALGGTAGGRLLGGKKKKEASLWKVAAFAFDAMASYEEKQSSVTSPKSQLSKTQAKFQGPRLSAPPGPSIAQVSKPKGYGTPLPGATKS